MRRLRSPAVLAALALLLGACTSTAPPRPVQTPPPPAQTSLDELRDARQQTLLAMNAWRVQGKVAYRLPDDGGSASLDWRQDDEYSRLRLSGPLGVASTRIVNEGALLRVSRDGIERLYPADGAPWLPGGALLPIPVTSIQYWLRGLADPSLPVEAIDYEGVAPRSLTQHGWQVLYETFREERGVTLPARLNLLAPAADLSLRIVLRNWDLEGIGSEDAPES